MDASDFEKALTSVTGLNVGALTREFAHKEGEDIHAWFEDYMNRAKASGEIWLEDVSGEAFHEVHDIAEHVTDFVEKFVSDATRGLAKEDLAVQLATGPVARLIEPLLPGGAAGTIARKMAGPMIEKGLRKLIKGAVEYRNATVGKDWGTRARNLSKKLQYKFETLTGMDTDHDGYIGEPPPVTLAVSRDVNGNPVRVKVIPDQE